MIRVSGQLPKGKSITAEEVCEAFQKASPVTQMAVILAALALLVLPAIAPTLGTSILVALKTLTTR